MGGPEAEEVAEVAPAGAVPMAMVGNFAWCAVGGVGVGKGMVETAVMAATEVRQA